MEILQYPGQLDPGLAEFGKRVGEAFLFSAALTGAWEGVKWIRRKVIILGKPQEEEPFQSSLQSPGETDIHVRR